MTSTRRHVFSKKSVQHIKNFGPLLGIISSRQLNPVQRKRIIDSLNAGQIRAFVSMMKDIEDCKKNLPVDICEMIRKKKKLIKKLLEKKTSQQSKKSALKHQGGFLPFLLGTLATQAIPSIIKGIGHLFGLH
jgi:hypothetical protein